MKILLISDNDCVAIAAVVLVAQSPVPLSAKDVCETLKIPPRRLETRLQPSFTARS